MGYSEAGGKLIDEKNQKRKISWHCPFTSSLKRPLLQNFLYLNIHLLKIEDSASISRGLHLYNNVNIVYLYKLQAQQN
jgi:hypothetical protein